MTTRRRLLIGLASALLALAPLHRRASAAIAAPSSHRLGRRLAGVLSNPASARRLGRAVIRSGAVSHLDRRLLEFRLKSVIGVPGSTDRQLRGAIRDIVAADFAAERMVSVDGWRLAESEALIYRVIAEDTSLLS